MLSPLKIFALILGLIIFIISFSSTNIALYILIFSMLLSPEFIIGKTSSATMARGVTLRLDDIILLIIGLSWLARMAINKDLGLFLKTPLNKPIAYYIIICLVSTLFGTLFGDVQLKTGALFVLKYFEYIIVYFMVLNFLKNKKQVRNYLWAILITCAIVSLIGISQIPLGGRVTAPFEGASGEPNTLGGYLVLLISITCGLLLTSPSLKNNLLYGALIILCLAPFFYTQSRSSYVALIPALMTFIILSPKRKWIFTALVIIGTILPFIAPRVARERIAYTFVQGKNRLDTFKIGGIRLDTSTSERLYSWQSATKDWIKHPILGYGVTGYRFLDAQYLRVLVETGALGLFAFLFLLAQIYRQAKRIFKSSGNPFEEGLSMGFLAGFTGLLIHSMGANTFIIVRIMEPFWFIAALVLSLSHLKDDEEGGEGVSAPLTGGATIPAGLKRRPI
jgi:O-antigen ligase